MSDDRCTCDYVEVNGTRLMMRVYDERCPTHGPQDEAEVEKVPDLDPGPSGANIWLSDMVIAGEWRGIPWL